MPRGHKGERLPRSRACVGVLELLGPALFSRARGLGGVGYETSECALCGPLPRFACAVARNACAFPRRLCGRKHYANSTPARHFRRSVNTGEHTMTAKLEKLTRAEALARVLVAATARDEVDSAALHTTAGLLADLLADALDGR